jgi:malonate decarboxylase gamma subunit
MDWRDLLASLFGTTHDVCADHDFLSGHAMFDGNHICVVGTANHTPIGVSIALRHARAILDVMAAHPGRPILLLVDTQGQQLRRREELLGINRAMAHLGCCVDRARRNGHSVIGLVYSQALSGGFIASGLAADACYALADAEIRVMGIPAMARVTKLSEQMLTELGKSNPVFSPGVDNYVAMGGVRAIWTGDLANGLRAALADRETSDVRARDGAERGGRMLAQRVTRQVLDAP